MRDTASREVGCFMLGEQDNEIRLVWKKKVEEGNILSF